MEFSIGSVAANSIDFHYVELGAGPLVLCLHGFPDNAYTYRYLLPVLADAGFRGVAPFMRGYSPTGKPADDRFESILLGQDVVALIGALGAKEAFVVGHDWGGFATLASAVLAPERVRKIVTLGVAHRGVRGPDPGAALVARRTGLELEATELFGCQGWLGVGVVLAAGQQTPEQTRQLSRSGDDRDLMAAARTDPLIERAQRPRVLDGAPRCFDQRVARGC